MKERTLIKRTSLPSGLSSQKGKRVKRANRKIKGEKGKRATKVNSWSGCRGAAGHMAYPLSLLVQNCKCNK
jgi:hypothetical protein